jgi:biotin carboxylase
VAKKLLVLGAGLFQLRGIACAIDCGYEVITVDNIPTNPGHKIAHASKHCSTTDLDEVLKYAESMSIDGICTFASDVALYTTSYVCKRLSLKGPEDCQVQTTSDKFRFREFLKSNFFSVPGFLHVADVRKLDERDFYTNISSLDFPLMVKPTRSSGSKGVHKIEQYEVDEISKAIKSARNFSLTSEVIVESYIEGEEVGGDAFLLNGEFIFLAITRKHKEQFWVRGHSVPPKISRVQQNDVRILLERLCKILNYTNGPVNFDLIVNDDLITILEISLRTGGNGIPELLTLSYGFDVELATIQYAMGEKIPTFTNADVQPYGTFVIFSTRSGVLRNCIDIKCMYKNFPNIVSGTFVFNEGDTFLPIQEGGRPLGYLVFRSSGDDNYALMTKTFTDILQGDISL